MSTVYTFKGCLVGAALAEIISQLNSPIDIVELDHTRPLAEQRQELADIRLPALRPFAIVGGRTIFSLYAILIHVLNKANIPEPSYLASAARTLDWAVVNTAIARPNSFFIADRQRESACAQPSFTGSSDRVSAVLHAAIEKVSAATDEQVATTLRMHHVPHDHYYEMTSYEPGRTLYVTTPIYYVNAPPHIGHVYSTVLADSYARWMRLRGLPCVFQTGTDEHGMKVQRAAEQRGMTPMEHCSSLVPAFISAFKMVNTDYQRFIRTTDEDHIHAAQEMWRRLRDKGYIYKASFSSWYCVSDEAFVTEKDTSVVVDPQTGAESRVLTETGQPVVWLEEENYMLRLSALSDQLLEFYAAHPNWIYPAFRLREVAAFVRSGLQDISISRQKAKLSWGVPVPDDDEHVMYVWIDALTNYLTGAGWPDHMTCWPAVHVIGKDIMRFHAVIWPAMLLAVGVEPPSSMIVHGWWTKDRRKIGKSLGNALDPVDLIERYGVDPVRWFFLRTADASFDADYSENEMYSRTCGDLADNIGNLLSRALAPRVNIFGCIPELPEGCEGDAERQLRGRLDRLPGAVDHYMTMPLDTRDACLAIMELATAVNQYVQNAKPWSIVSQAEQDEDARKRLQTIVHFLAEAVRILFTLMTPFTPESSGKALDWLGVPAELRNTQSCYVGAGVGCKLNAPEKPVLFPKPVDPSK